MVFYQNYIKTKLLIASNKKKNLPNFVTETRENTCQNKNNPELDIFMRHQNASTNCKTFKSLTNE